jgi:transcriptional regulator with GAF, ATPase, and Fis domain
MPVVWDTLGDSLRQGETLYVADRANERRIGPARVSSSGPASFAVVPVFEDETLVALLYVDSRETNFCDGLGLERLAKFSRIIAKAVTDVAAPAAAAESWESYLERTPVEDMEREKLLLLLNRNEWNISRVSRLMGVTRRTVYLRLQRYGIPRERVARTRVRTALA